MKLQALAALLSAVGAANAHGINPRHAQLHKRQDTTAATDSTPSTDAGTTATPTDAASATLSATGSGVPALSDITFGMPTGTVYAASTTVTAGYVPTISAIPDAPAIPGCTSTFDVLPGSGLNVSSCIQTRGMARPGCSTPDWYASKIIFLSVSLSYLSLFSR